MFTFTPWFFIPIGYTPMILYYLSLSLGLLAAPQLMIAFLIGMFYWTFCEYYMHRFIFHGEETWLPNNNFAFAFHFITHGLHHAYPMDRYRLVFPPIFGFFLH